MEENRKYIFNIPGDKDMERKLKWDPDIPIGLVIVNSDSFSYKLFISKAEHCKKYEGLRWPDPDEVLKKPGGLFFFCEPDKIVDVCIVHSIKEKELLISPPLSTILWKDWKWYMPSGWKIKKEDMPFLADTMQKNIVNLFKKHTKN